MSEGGGSRRPPPPGRRKASCEKHLECLFCNHLFSRYRDLETHMNTHTSERPHHCPQCDLYFSSGSRLWDHRQVVHMGVKRTCEFCGKEFTNISNLCEHRRRVHKEEWAERKNNEGGCLNSLSNIVKNIVVNKKKEIKVKKKEKSKIIKKKTEKKRKKRKKKKESSEEDTTDSEISHLEEEEPPLVELTDTEEEQEVGGEVQQEEEECQIVEIIQAPPEKKMKRTKLPSVMKVGQGKKRWECDICGKVFFRRDDYSLNRHKRNVHQDLYIVQKESAVPLQMPPTPLALVVCEHEQASTIQLSNFNSVNSSSIEGGSLKMVIKNYKNGTKVEPQVKRFWKCDICNKSFYRKDDYSLRRHKRTVHRDIFEQQGPRPPQPSSLSPQLPLSAQHLENEEVTPLSTETKSVKSKNVQRKNFQKLTQMRNKRKKAWVENKQKRLWQCDHCGCTFYGRNRASLNRHLKNVHNIDLQENEEGDPNLESQSQESQHLEVVLTEDINNKTDEENANVEEDQSDEEYLPNLPMKPKSKKRKRNGVMPKWKKKRIFKCDLCGKSFCCKDRHTLNRHLKNVHRVNANSVISSPACEPPLPAPSTSSKPPPSKKMKSSERGVVASVGKSQKKVRSKTSKKITAKSRKLGGKSGVTEDGTNIWRCYVCGKEYIRRDRYNLTRHIITKHLSGQDSSEEEEDDLDLEDHSMEEAVTEDEEENEQEEVEEEEDTDNEENLRKYADFFANPPSPSPPPAPPEFAAQFQFPPTFKLLNFPLENRFAKPKRVWDPGFFLHMNRYTPDEPQNSAIVHPVTAPPTDSREELEVLEDGDEEYEENYDYDSRECPKCKKVFKDKWSLKRHLKSRGDCVLRKMREDNPVKIIYWCCFCKKVMGQWKKSTAAKHMAFAHRFEDTPQDWEAYRISAESSHNGGIRRNFPDVSCAFCEFKSTSKETLREHIMERHSERLIMTPEELINLENEERNAGVGDVKVTTEQSKTEDNQNQVPDQGLPSSLPAEVQTIKSPVPLPTKLESLPTMVPSIETVPEAQLLAVDLASPQSPLPPPVQLQVPPPQPVTVVTCPSPSQLPESCSSHQSVENPHHETLTESPNYQTSFPETQSEFSLLQSEKSTEQKHSPPSTHNQFPENQPQYRSSTWLHTLKTGLKSFFNQFQLPQSTTQRELPPPVLPSQSLKINDTTPMHHEALEPQSVPPSSSMKYLQSPSYVEPESTSESTVAGYTGLDEMVETIIGLQSPTKPQESVVNSPEAPESSPVQPNLFELQPPLSPPTQQFGSHYIQHQPLQTQLNPQPRPCSPEFLHTYPHSSINLQDSDFSAKPQSPLYPTFQVPQAQSDFSNSTPIQFQSETVVTPQYSQFQSLPAQFPDAPTPAATTDSSKNAKSNELFENPSWSSPPRQNEENQEDDSNINSDSSSGPSIKTNCAVETSPMSSSDDKKSRSSAASILTLEAQFEGQESTDQILYQPNTEPSSPSPPMSCHPINAENDSKIEQSAPQATSLVPYDIEEVSESALEYNVPGPLPPAAQPVTWSDPTDYQDEANGSQSSLSSPMKIVTSVQLACSRALALLDSFSPERNLEEYEEDGYPSFEETLPSPIPAEVILTTEDVEVQKDKGVNNELPCSPVSSSQLVNQSPPSALTATPSPNSSLMKDEKESSLPSKTETSVSPITVSPEKVENGQECSELSPASPIPAEAPLQSSIDAIPVSATSEQSEITPLSPLEQMEVEEEEIVGEREDEDCAANGIITLPFASTIVTSETHSQNIGSPVLSTSEPEMKSSQESFSSAVDEEVDIDDPDSEFDTTVSSQSSGVICVSNTSIENPASSPSSQENRASSPKPLPSTTPPRNSPALSPPPHEYSAPLSQLPQENVSCVGNSPPSQENLGYTSPAPPSSSAHLPMPLLENNDPKSPSVSDKSVHLSPECPPSPSSPPPAEYSSPVHPEPEYSVPLIPPPVEYLTHSSPTALKSPATRSAPLQDDSENASSESSENSDIPATTLLESSVISISLSPSLEYSASSTTPTPLEDSGHLSQESLAPSSPLLPSPETVADQSPPPGPETDACSPAGADAVKYSTPSSPEYSAHSSSSPSERSASASQLHDDKAVLSPPQSTEMYLEPSSSENLLLPQPSRENSGLSSPITADYSSVLPSPENTASSPQPAQPPPLENEASRSQFHLDSSESSPHPPSENTASSASPQPPSDSADYSVPSTTENAASSSQLYSETAASSPQPSPSENEASSSQLHLEGSASSPQPPSESAASSSSPQLPSDSAGYSVPLSLENSVPSPQIPPKKKLYFLKERKKKLRSPRKKIKLSATPIPGSSKPISTTPARTEKPVANSPDATPSPVTPDATQENEEVSTTVLPTIPTSAESCDNDDQQSAPSNLVEPLITSPRPSPSPPITTGSTLPTSSTERPDCVECQCQKCSKVHPNNWSLAIHQNILGDHCPLLMDMESAPDRCILFYCVFCQKKFEDANKPTQSYYLARHIAGVHPFHLHANDANAGNTTRSRKDFSCAFCGQKGREKDTLRKHIVEKHREMLGRPRDMEREAADALWQNVVSHAGGTGQEAVAGPSSHAQGAGCPFCEQNSFCDRYKLVRHIASCHKQNSGSGAVDTTKTGRLQCAFCGYESRRKDINKMTRHILGKHVQLLDQPITANLDSHDANVANMEESKGVNMQEERSVDVEEIEETVNTEEPTPLNVNMEESQPMDMEETQTIESEEIPSVSQEEATQPVEFEDEAVDLEETMVIDEDEMEDLEEEELPPPLTPAVQELTREPSETEEEAEMPLLSPAVVLNEIDEEEEESFERQGGITPPPSEAPRSQFSCDKCGRRFPNKNGLKDHHRKVVNCERLKDTPASLYFYSCPFCRFEFGRKKDDLIKHVVRRHRYNVQNEASGGTLAGSYSCGVCGKSCMSLELLERHTLKDHLEMLRRKL